MMKLTYIYHSGYALEFDNFTIIIDYYKDSENKIVYNSLLKKKSRLYVLSTHSHADHFNPEILEWKSINADIVYIFSKDILKNKKINSEGIIFLDKLDLYHDDYLSARAYGSTDIGVSFLFNIKEYTIFHAGDLNNWHWNEESTKDEIREAEQYYTQELDLLAKDIEYLNLAMFPVDPRLGKDYMKGAEQFVATIRTDFFAPMHFDKAYDKAAAFADFALTKSCKCICWRHSGESVVF